jgi:hypothetical protein
MNFEMTTYFPDKELKPEVRETSEQCMRTDMETRDIDTMRQQCSLQAMQAPNEKKMARRLQFRTVLNTSCAIISWHSAMQVECCQILLCASKRALGNFIAFVDASALLLSNCKHLLALCRKLVRVAKCTTNTEQ